MGSSLQILGAFFGLSLSYFTFLNLKRKEFTLREFLAWEFLWIGFTLVAWFPGEFSIFNGALGVFRPLDLFTVVGFLIVLSISFYTYVNLDRLRRKLEKTIRDLALSEDEVK